MILRLVVLLVLQDQPLIGDPRSYHRVALQILSGVQYIPEWPPGLPHYLAGVYLIIGDSEFSARVATLVLSLAFILLFRKLMIEIVGHKLAALGLAIIAVYPAFVHHSVDALSHLPVALCMTVALLCVLRLWRGATWWYAVLLGAALGAMILIRPSNLLFLLVVPAFVVWKRRDWRLPVATIGMGLLLLGIWLHQAQKLAGEFIWINTFNNYNFFIGNSEFTPMYKTWWIGSHGAEGLTDSARFVQIVDSANRLPLREKQAVYSSLSRKHILEEPGMFVVRSINRFNSFFAFDSFTGSFVKNVSSSRILLFGVLAFDAVFFLSLLFFTVALLTLHWREVRSSAFLLLAVVTIVIHGSPYWISFASPVYHTALLPIMLLLMLYFIKLSPPRSWKHNWQTLYTRPQRIAFTLAMLYALFIQVQFIYHMADRV
jgi:4-amino-4-deoxy-L-arabinose transferase-like glycosyltransferase